MSPPLRVKLAFWLLLGLLSTALAEVPSGSAPFVLFTPWGLLVTLPLYLLHAVFLAGLVYRYSDTFRLESLYLAGALFGLYEAYLTKVLWTPTWEPIPIRVGGVHVFESVLLVLFWHPLFAFVLPLLVVETLCTRSRLVARGFPSGSGSRLFGRPGRAVAAGAILVGLFQGTIVPDPVTAMASAVATSSALAAAIVLWRRRVGAKRYTVDQLLPAGRELGAVGTLLVAMYVVYGAGLRPEHLPGLASQSTVWALYLLIGSLLVLRLRRDRRGSDATAVGGTVALRPLARYVVVYVLAVAAGTVLLRPLASAAFVVLYVVAFAVGGTTLVRIVRGLRLPAVVAEAAGRTRRGIG